jgi:hypothetical protein
MAKPDRPASGSSHGCISTARHAPDIDWRRRTAPPLRTGGGTTRTVATLRPRCGRWKWLERLRSTTDVENLESTYGYYADKSMQDAISALFAQN